MKPTNAHDTATIEAELALLRRRFARSEAARGQAEALLEEKTHALAETIDDLNHHKDLLAAQLSQRIRQLLDAQRVAGFGTMIWDIVAEKGELSPYSQAMLGLSGNHEIHSIIPAIQRVIEEDRDKAMNWARSIANSAQAQAQTAPQAEQDLGGSGTDLLARPGAKPHSDQALSDLALVVRIAGASPDEPNRMIRVMAQSEYDQGLKHSLIFLTLQDVTRDVEAANEAEALRQRDQLRLVELEELTGKLHAARETAEAASAAKTRFLAMMSHDIRTPMNGVLGMLELFDEQGLTQGQRQTLMHLKASGEQLRVLLDDIIDLARAEAGKLTLDRQPVELSSLLTTSVGFWAKAANDKGLRFDVVRGAFGWPASPPRWIYADRHRLRQLIDNLLSNAIKYTHEGEITVRVGLVGPKRMRFEVTDTGIGIPPELRRELFQDFGQLYLDGDRVHGSGLGLAICKRIVDLKEGEIGVDANPDRQGSVFWLELPFNEIEGPPSVGVTGKQLLRHPDDRPPRILVAEDVEVNRIVAKGLLGRLGAEVELVADGEAAVEAVQRSSFDLVLMDMSMPGVDGPEATRRIRALDGPVSEIPILALTAYSRPEELAPMMEAGAQGRISKPIKLDDMYKAIMAVCCQVHGSENE